MVGKHEASPHSVDRYFGLGTIHAGKRGETLAEARELIPELHLTGQFLEAAEQPGLYTLRFVVTVQGATGPVVRDTRLFHNVSLPEGFTTEPFDLTEAVAEQIGFQFSSRVYQNEEGGHTDVEKRFKIERIETGEKQTVTVSTADHWQNSHSHRAFIEQYTLTAGTIKLVEDYGEGQLRVVTVTKIKNGHHIREEIFNEYGELVEQISDQDVGNFSYLATETDKPHNVWVSKDAVFGAVTGKVAEGKKDWNSAPEFNERIRRAGL